MITVISYWINLILKKNLESQLSIMS
jgi:hypothetical protein